MKLLVTSFIYLVSSSVLTFNGISLEEHNVCDFSTASENTRILNQQLEMLQLGVFDEFIFPNNTYCLGGGVQGVNFENVIVRIEGTLEFYAVSKPKFLPLSYDCECPLWPQGTPEYLLECKPNLLSVFTRLCAIQQDPAQCLHFKGLNNVSFTSSQNKAKINGNGQSWWGLNNYIQNAERRPRLIYIEDSSNLLVENLYLYNSPLYSFDAFNVTNMTIRYIDIHAGVAEDEHSGHESVLDKNGQMTHPIANAFNTDGFDIAGKNIHVHNCRIWNQDDCIAVKDNKAADGSARGVSENMVFENITASGLGLVIGSISNSKVRNITFRNIYMEKTFKGIYLKFRNKGNKSHPGHIEDVLFENITMDDPEQWPIWIGPAQQVGKDLLGNPCSLAWPVLPFAKCNVVPYQYYTNITLRNITINRPVFPTGVILGEDKFMMQNITFENVVANLPKHKRFWKGLFTSNPLARLFTDSSALFQNLEEYYKCEGVNSTNSFAVGNVSPVPGCFNKSLLAVPVQKTASRGEL